MSYKNIFISLALIFFVECTAGVKKILVYKKDMSEYCRRQVAPALMLGRHSPEASSMTLQLSRLELPYTCYMTVRTEFGNGIILVVQSDEMSSTCQFAGNQLVVYHMEDTFGSYRGPIEDSFTDFDKKYEDVFYTMKPSIETSQQATNATYNDTEVTQKFDAKSNATTWRDELVVEVPLVNVSGYLVDSERAFSTQDTDIAFDMLYDVTPGPGVKYDTSIMPLVWFSLSKKADYDLNYDYGNRRYQLDNNNNVNSNRTSVPKVRFSKNERKKDKIKMRDTVSYFKEITQTFDKKIKKPKTFNLQRHYKKPKYHRNDVAFSRNQVLSTGTTDAWVNLLDLIKNMNKSVAKKWYTAKYLYENGNSDEVSLLLQKLSNRNNNMSIYRQTVSDYFEGKNSVTIPTLKKALKLDIGNFRRTSLKYTRKSPEMLLKTYYKTVHPLLSIRTMAKENTTVETLNTTRGLKFQTSSRDVLNSTDTTRMKLIASRKTLPSVIPNDLVSNKHQETLRYHIVNEDNKLPFLFTDGIPANDKTKSLVDHESWENVVKAAPEMAMKIINSTSQEPLIVKELNQKSGKIRKKRFIESIPLFEATPHGLSTRKKYTMTAATVYNDFIGSVHKKGKFDIPEMKQPEYDQLAGRIDMHHWSDHNGPVVYNICHHYTGTNNKYRQAILLNSSRIIISINDFSMKSLMLVLTTTKILLRNDSQCPPSHVECQVTGARVCIEASCACDGIPNCGAYEIYDEDRLHCNSDVNEHNVVLAAFTFIAVILTILYSVYYWIKRCVPRVSEAFFVYTEDGDNVLYLDSVMRSPLDDEPTTMQYHGKFDDDYIPEKRHDKSILKKIWLICCCGFIKKKVLSDETEKPDPLRKVYSFTEFEINKMVGVQTKSDTGDSTEMDNLYKIDKKYNRPNQAMETIQEHGSLNDINKLTLMMEPTHYKRKHSKCANLPNSLDTIQCKSLSSSSLSETETNNHIFSQGHIKSSLQVMSSSIDIHEEPIKQSATQTRKRIRFEERNNSSNPVISPLPRRLSLARVRTKHLPDSDNVNREATLSHLGRDFKRFWPGIKRKKSGDKK